MILNKIPNPARRFLMERLRRLQEALEALGQRLREGISQLIGKHVGDAVRDAIESVLCKEPVYHPPERPIPQYRSYHDPYDYPHEEYPEEGFWGDRESVYEEPEPEQKVSRWRPLLAGLAQLVTWTVHRIPKHRPLKKLVCIGAAAGIITLVAGPLAGGIVMTVGTTVLMTRLADRTTDIVGQLATVAAP
jgi:hypothetical protein